jgi:hypothetical protein
MWRVFSLFSVSLICFLGSQRALAQFPEEAFREKCRMVIVIDVLRRFCSIWSATEIEGLGAESTKLMLAKEHGI